MDCQKDCCHACWRATAADADPTGHVVVYWASKSPLRWTNAVAPGATRLIAPPSASSAIPPDAPGAPATFWKFSTPASRVPIPWLLSGLVKKSDLADSEARESWPPEVWVGRWHSFTVRLAQPASTSIACSQVVLSRNGEDGSDPTAAYSFSS
jgi:hypothetical protein